MNYARIVASVCGPLLLAGCSSSLEGPAPKIAAATPALVCAEQLVTPVTLRGTGFSPLPVDVLVGADLELPKVTLSRSADLGGAAATGAVSVPDGQEEAHVRWLSAKELAFDVFPELALFPGVYAVSLKNGNGKTTRAPDALVAVPPPVLASVEPDLLCGDQANSFTLTGTGFLRLADGSLPSIRIGDGDSGRTYQPTELGGCTALAGPTGAQSCTVAELTIPAGDLAPGRYAVTLTNPGSASCTSLQSQALEIVAAPAVASVEPAQACMDGSDLPFRVEGSGFLVVDGAGPAVRFGGTELAAAVDASSCTAIDGLHQQVQRCTALTFTVADGTFDPGTWDVTVQNPDPAGCASSEPVSVRLVGQPVVTSAVPARICSGGGSLLVGGDRFEPGATATLGGLPATSVEVHSGNELQASFGPGLETGGPYDLVVENVPGCSGTLAGTVEVIPGPQLFFADPPVVYDGISTRVLLYATGVSDTVEAISLRRVGSDEPPLVVEHEWSADRPNRVQIVVPAGTAPGDYDVILSDTTECSALLAGGLRVTGTLSVSVASIDPPFGWTDRDTAVTLRGEEPTPTGQAGFVPVPRLYLNPSDPAEGSLAMPLSSAAVLSPTSATAVVPDGLPAGSYDLIVVNPDGSVGLLERAFRVTDLPPPAIATISPGSIPNSAGQQVIVFGSDFRSPEVSLACKDAGTGAIDELSATVTASTDTQAVAVVDASSLGGGAICVVRVTNPDQQTWGEFSALVVTNPAQNLGVTRPGPDLLLTRRGPAAASGSVTGASRFLYVAGGDDGTGLGVRSEVESAPVDIYGTPSAFTMQRYGLATARAFAGTVRIGRFLYVVGGTDGVAPLATVERAWLLDPADRPEITDLQIELEEEGGLEPGVYSYRVAALRAADHPENPGGEELPSEPFPVILPRIDGKSLRVELTWSPVPDTVGYRIYRSPAAGDAFGSERLVAEVNDPAVTSLTDDGLVAGELAPLPLGSTGTWSVVATLGTARQGAGVAAVAGVPGAWTIYVAGGLGASGPVSSIETLPVQEAPDGSQLVGLPVISARALSRARWDMGAYAVTHDVSSRLDSPWLYFAGGLTDVAGDVVNGAVDAFPVAEDGTLGAPVAVDSMSPARAGFGAAAANNFLHAFGGRSTSTSVASAEHCGAGRSCPGGATVPELVNWNSAGNLDFPSRMDMGTAIQSGFIYLLGGSDGTRALRSTRLTHW